MIGTKILFLEDNTLYQESIQDFLEEEDFIVDPCKDGQEFLNKIFNNVYDLYLMDINVPLINGLELLKILKEYNDTTMKLVLTSFPESVMKSFENGCDDFLNKRLYMDQKSVELDTQSLLVLDCLIKNREQFVSSDELEKNIYPSNSKSKSNVIRYYIWHLRNILGKEIIESKRKFGYRLTSSNLAAS